VKPQEKYLQEIEENVENLSKWHRHDEEELQPDCMFK